VIRAKVNAVTNPNGEVMLSLEERFDADSTTTFGPLSVLVQFSNWSCFVAIIVRLI
jgi:hypothetical protein